jgi:DNA-binding transcriptional MerR regulator
VKYGYTVNSVYTIARDFKVRLMHCLEHKKDPFFQILKPGRKKSDRNDELVDTILSFRKKQLSIPDIKILLDGKDPDTGILCYGDTTVKHDNQDNVILEFLDFYREGTGRKINYVVFDSKFTTLENLGRINEKGIKFITIQRKSKKLNEKIQEIHQSQWHTIKIEKSNHKSRTVVYSEGRDNCQNESQTLITALEGKHP